MLSLTVPSHGEPEVMTLEEKALPEPEAGFVRVKVEAAGLNFIDIYQCTGQYKMQLPFVPGQEAAGIVDAVGEGVTEFAPGDRVAYAFVIGAFAQYALVPAQKLIKLPEGMEPRIAAALLLQGMTAHYLAVDTFPIHPGHTALIHAAAGGTGQLLVQVAKLRGARVLATVSTKAKAALAREAGADEVYLYEDFENEVKRATDGHGVDVVYDSVGKDTFDRSLNCLRPRGYMVLFGQSSGAVPPLDPQTLNARGSLFLTRPSLGYYIRTREELLSRASDLFRWVLEDQLRVRIDRTYPLAEAAEAYRTLTSRVATGKILLIPTH